MKAENKGYLLKMFGDLILVVNIYHLYKKEWVSFILYLLLGLLLRFGGNIELNKPRNSAIKHGGKE